MSEQVSREAFVGGAFRFGTFSPTHYVVAAFDAVNDAELAARAIRRAGFAAGALRCWSGAEVLEQHRAFRRCWTLWDRLGASLAAIMGEEPLAEREYLALAERGHWFLTVYAPRPEVVERARRALSAHGGHAMRHYDHLTIADLPGETSPTIGTAAAAA